MKKVLLTMLLFVSLDIVAQIPEKKLLIVDETQVVKSGDNRFRVITSNDSISRVVMDTYIRTIILSYSAYKREDRRGSYWEYSYYFDNKYYDAVVTYIKKRFR